MSLSGALATEPVGRRAEPCDATYLLASLTEAQRFLREGDGARAEPVLQEVLTHAPDHSDAHNLLSVALGLMGRPAEAEPHSRRALELLPEDAGYLLNLANRLKELGRLDEAIAAYRDAHLAAPRDPLNLKSLARMLAECERWDEAVEIAGKVGDCSSVEPEVLVECAKILTLGGTPQAAPALIQQAIEQAPDQSKWWLDLARVTTKLQQFDLATEALERVLETEPDLVEARVMLASILFRKRDFSRLTELLGGIEAQGMDAANAVNLSGMMMVSQGKIEEGLEAMALVDELAPLSAELQMTRIMYLNYHPEISRDALFREHQTFGTRFADKIAPVASRFDLTADPERRLRIGYVSPDFRAHSVAYFAAPIFQAFDRKRFDLVAYAHVTKPDHVTAHLRALVSEWHEITFMDDQKLAEKIRDDRIDVLVDLGGYTADTRLLALTGRPAPVQISYLGYPNTTGLPQVDYRITDGMADPDDADDLYTETLIRLPRCFLCYAIPSHAPPVGPPPFERNDHITFGSFNNLNKVNRKVIELWAQVLHAVPNSRLLLKAHSAGDEITRNYLRDVFVEVGIDPERVEFAEFKTAPTDHLAVYNEVDVALDTFPYHGTTTTCEALWMGVPVITLVGDRHPSRVGASLLGSIGFTAGITASPDEYVTTARLMAEHPDLIRAARGGLRADVARSPLCDMNAHARALEEAYRAVWRIWCEDQSASS